MHTIKYIIIGTAGIMSGIYTAPYLSNDTLGKLMISSIIENDTATQVMDTTSNMPISKNIVHEYYRGGIDNKSDIDMQIRTKQINNDTLEVSLDIINSGSKDVKMPIIEVQIPPSYTYKTASIVISGDAQTDTDDNDYAAMYDNTMIIELPILPNHTTKTAVMTLLKSKNKHYGMTTNGMFIDILNPDYPLFTTPNKTIYASTIDNTGTNIYYMDDVSSVLYSTHMATGETIEYPFKPLDSALISGMTFINNDEIMLLDAHNSVLYRYSLSAKKAINTVSIRYTDGVKVLPQGGDIAVLDNKTLLLLTNSSDNYTSMIYRIDISSGLTEPYMAVLPEAKYDGIDAYNDGTLIINNSDGMYIKNSDDAVFKAYDGSVKIGYETDNTAVIDNNTVLDISFTDAYKWRFEKQIVLDNSAYEYHFDNAIPVFTTLPKTTLSYNIPYKQLITGVDSDNDTLSLALIKAPSWVSIRDMEMIITPLEIGSFDVIIALTDGHGGIVEHRYTLIIEPSKDITENTIAGEYTYKSSVNSEEHHIILHPDSTITWYDGTPYTWEYKGKELILSAPDMPSIHYTALHDDVFESDNSRLIAYNHFL